MPTTPDANPFEYSSGARPSVWVHQNPYANIPHFQPLRENIECDVCIVGAGIAGISTAYELVLKDKKVVLIDAREVLSGETGRTSGHLNFALDDGYSAISAKHGKHGAKVAAESHSWAISRVSEIISTLGIDCEFRRVPAYDISQYPRGDPKHDREIQELKDEAEFSRQLGVDVVFKKDLAIRGWDGPVDQRDGIVWAEQAAFHPTKYLVGILEWLKKQQNFTCYTQTRAISIGEKRCEMAGMGRSVAQIKTEGGHTIIAESAVEATCIPLQKLSVVGELVYNRSYCIAIRVPKDSVEDCLIYDQADTYKYVRLTACDHKDDYLVVGGCDHKVGQEETESRFAELETWARQRFTQAGLVDYKWSGQIYEPHDYLGIIGKNPGCKHTFIVTGDSGDGLSNGVLAGRLLADEICGITNPWAKTYAPARVASILKSLTSAVGHVVQINTQYKRYLQADIQDIEDLAPGTGGILNPPLGMPIAVYRSKDGKVSKWSAVCPHMKGVVCWNATEETFDCPVHGSRFSKYGLCVNGPAKMNLPPAN